MIFEPGYFPEARPLICVRSVDTRNEAASVVRTISSRNLRRVRWKLANRKPRARKALRRAGLNFLSRSASG